MGKDLMQITICAESLRKSHTILASKGIDLLNIITQDDPSVFDNVTNIFVGICAIQVRNFVKYTRVYFQYEFKKP